MRRLLVPALAIFGLAVVLIGVLVVVNLARPEPRRAAPPAYHVPILDVAPGTAVPFQTPAGELLARLAGATDIPERTLRAYTAAEAQLASRAPECGLTWATLAGVGRVESRHGRVGGATVADDGTLTPPIIGVALDGSRGVRAIRDTDDGRLDGDQEWDRAVGAMQFLPTTWARWATRASSDGQRPDPQNIDDAVLSAARYLCASGGTLGTPAGWWKAVLTYNRSASYARNVFSAADAYARTAANLT